MGNARCNVKYRNGCPILFGPPRFLKGTHMAGLIQFIDDDSGYLNWLAANPNGFVVNSERTPKSGYLILHRVSCSHINSSDRKNWTTTGYAKTCSLDQSALAAWASAITSGVLDACHFCKPTDRTDVDSKSDARTDHPTALAKLASPNSLEPSIRVSEPTCKTRQR